MEKFTPSPKPFLDEDRINELLEGLTSGTTFLVTILRDEDAGNAFCAAAQLESVASELAGLLGEHPAVLNQAHPEYESFRRAIREAQEAITARLPKATENMGPGKPVVLLVPRSPNGEPAPVA